jgi:endonuclease/exonuclease/phosphatase (EEP) superfamily protein YafD
MRAGFVGTQCVRAACALRAAVAIGLFVGLLGLVLAWLLMPGLEHESRLSLLWAYFSFMARTFTFHAGMGLLALAGAAIVLRWRNIAMVALLCGVASISVEAGGFMRNIVPAPREARAQHASAAGLGSQGTLGEDSTELTIFSANVLYKNADAVSLLREIERVQPDVVILQEYTKAMSDALRPSLVRTHPYVVEALGRGRFGHAVYSERPFVSEPQVFDEVALQDGRRVHSGNGPQVRVRVQAGDRVVTIQNVHTHSPGSLAWFAAQRRAFVWHGEWVQAALREGPVIMAGDFNATQESGHFAGLEALGMRDAHTAAGNARASTWPATSPLRHLPGVRIDHVLVSPDVDVMWCEVGSVVGSDHRPVAARVHVR